MTEEVDGQEAEQPEPTDPGIEILMSRTHPEGWKLESILGQLALEVGRKCENIQHDTSPVAAVVLLHNRQIMSLLWQAQALQSHSTTILDLLFVDPGPLGEPRIGVGSPNYRPSRRKSDGS